VFIAKGHLNGNEAFSKGAQCHHSANETFSACAETIHWLHCLEQEINWTWKIFFPKTYTNVHINIRNGTDDNLAQAT